MKHVEYFLVGLCILVTLPITVPLALVACIGYVCYCMGRDFILMVQGEDMGPML